MTIPEVGHATGLLPHGRHRVTEAEVQRSFVYTNGSSGSDVRAVIWAEYEDARDLLRTAVRVHAAWLGGSFTTKEPSPADIDVVFLISARDYALADSEAKKVVESFVPRPNALGALERGHGFKRVDSYVLPWHALADADPEASPAALQYCAMRGYWDDFWQRSRNGGKDSPKSWRDSLPVRGYLEVALDDFTR